ncbi:hypothetical protein CH267_06620 [Rhodococcus sp. 06-621-2]|nr:hypothetical protein CH267_06620 [Rhodococcus sp. 06-621-2]
MGGPMSTRLVERGITVTGFDPTAEATHRAEAAGVQIASTAAEAARGADFVILMLPNSAVVEAVVTSSDFESALSGEPIVLDMSSSDPVCTRKLASRLAELNVEMVDAPVSGGVSGAERGTLTIMVGGNDAAVTTSNQLLRILGTPRHAGPVGAGHALKAINNLLSATHLLATAEGVAIGERFGLDPALMVELVNTSSGRSGSTDNKYPNFILPGSFDSGFGLRLMLKDMKIATSLGTAMGAPAQLGAHAVELWEKASNALPPTADHTEIAKWATSPPLTTRRRRNE